MQHFFLFFLTNDYSENSNLAHKTYCMNPKVMKITFFSCIYLLCISYTFGQVDESKSTKNNSSSVSVAPSYAPLLPKNTLLGLKANNNEYKNPIDKILSSIIEEENRRALNNKGIIDPQKVHTERLKKEMAELNRQYVKIDQYLGGFSSTSESITIACRDFQFPDGDTVTIYLNEIPIIQNIVLTRSFQQFKLPLKKGLNVISFKALNQGTSGPNTAAFIIFDGQKVLSSNEWNLATGAKATLTIARVDE